RHALCRPQRRAQGRARAEAAHAPREAALGARVAVGIIPLGMTLRSALAGPVERVAAAVGRQRMSAELVLLRQGKRARVFRALLARLVFEPCEFATVEDAVL